MTTNCTERKISSTWVLSGLWNGVCCRSKSTLRGCCQRFSLVFSRWNLASILTSKFRRQVIADNTKLENKQRMACYVFTKAPRFWYFFPRRHGVTDWSHCFLKRFIGLQLPFSHKTFNQKCIFRFVWLTEVLNRKVCLNFDREISVVKKWELGHWSRESEKHRHLDFGPEW